jgi:hypothetical protein
MPLPGSRLQSSALAVPITGSTAVSVTTGVVVTGVYGVGVSDTAKLVRGRVLIELFRVIAPSGQVPACGKALHPVTIFLHARERNNTGVGDRPIPQGRGGVVCIQLATSYSPTSVGGRRERDASALSTADSTSDARSARDRVTSPPPPPCSSSVPSRLVPGSVSGSLFLESSSDIVRPVGLGQPKH